MKKEAQGIFIITTILICVGIIMVYSSSSCYAYDKFQDSAFYLKRHLVHFIIGLALAAFALKVDYRKIKGHAKILLLVSFTALILVLVPGIGHEAGGAKRWF
ncbi:MAG: FtsW/RodA/SpoVE family cell cycle protein, partial [Candidatus Omnitrophica bacterium]|nr:FtsW/RodA/SpoVE family cell cycle protein [Candidatus Omnitrophota bacterium]